MYLFASHTIRSVSKVITQFPYLLGRGGRGSWECWNFIQVGPGRKELQPYSVQSVTCSMLSLLSSHPWHFLFSKLGWPYDYHLFWEWKVCYSDLFQKTWTRIRDWLGHVVAPLHACPLEGPVQLWICPYVTSLSPHWDESSASGSHLTSEPHFLLL